MKVAIALFALLALGSAAPQPRKLFHEHVEDFLHIIMEDTFDELDHLMGQYIEFEEFRVTFDYLRSANFKDLVYEMEALPEFQAVLEFLERDNIDIMYFVDRLNEMFENLEVRKSLQSRQNLSGRDFNAFLLNYIASWPKDKLAALFEEKKEEDPEFRAAIENLWSDECQSLVDALWANPTFMTEVATMEANGVMVATLLTHVKAMFGQD